MYVFCVVYICKPHKVTRMFAYRSINFLFACFISLATKYVLLLVFFIYRTISYAMRSKMFDLL